VNPQILAIILSVAMLLIVLALLRSYYLPEKYAVIWLLAAIAAIVLSVFPGLLDAIAGFFGIAQPINLLFVAGFFIVLLLLMQLSLELARTREQLRKVVQSMAVELEEKSRHDD